MPTDMEVKWRDVTGGDLSRSNNMVSAYVGGVETFEAMYEAILTANRQGHYIYLLAWYLDLDVRLRSNDTAGYSSLRTVLLAALKMGVQVRVMVAHNSIFDPAQCSEAIETINKWGGIMTLGRSGGQLPYDAAAISDSAVASYQFSAMEGLTLEQTVQLQSLAPAASRDISPGVGSHHQKVLLVRGSLGTIAFCGGVDINNDRILSVKEQVGSPMHDAHCRIMGPAAHDLVDVFLTRWQAHPDHVAIDNRRQPVALTDRSHLGRPKRGDISVRIARNFNFIRPKGDFCAKEHSIEPLMLAAIKNARNTIYIEDQYLANLDAAEAIRRQLNALKLVVIIVPHPIIEPVFPWKRKEFLRILGYGNNSTGKVKVFFRFDKGRYIFGDGTYIHSKTWIFDDELAVIGSANCNRRGWGSDSEVVAAIFDKPSSLPPKSFAQKLRIRLWAKHLGLSGKELDKIKHGFSPESISLWTVPPSSASVKAYMIDSDFAYRATPLWSILDPMSDEAWKLVDPDGRTMRVCDGSEKVRR